MTRKHFERAAALVRDIAAYHSQAEAGIACEAFASLFSGCNPRFDANRFRNACRVDSGKETSKKAA